MLKGKREEQHQAQSSQAKLQAGSAHQHMSDRYVWATPTVSNPEHNSIHMYSEYYTAMNERLQHGGTSRTVLRDSQTQEHRGPGAPRAANEIEYPVMGLCLPLRRQNVLDSGKDR